MGDYATDNGEKFANWIAAVWQRGTHNYYTSGNKELESVKDLIASEKRDEVFKIWRKFAHNESTVVAKHASYNSIISYEMEDKLDSAPYMAGDAYKRFHSKEIANYKLILDDRIWEKESVIRQLGLNVFKVQPVKP